MSRALMRWSGPLMAVVAGAAFWYFSHGGIAATTMVRAYAEAVEHPVASLGAGRLATVAVHVGQQVKAGDVLATIDTIDMEIQRDAARAALAQAKADLVAQEIVQRAAVARAELLVLRLKRSESQDRAQLEALKEQAARLDKLAGQQLVQQREIEESKLRRAGLEADLDLLEQAQREQLAGLGSTLRRTKTEEQVQTRLEPYRQAVALRETALRAAERAIEEATLRARTDGVISLVLHYPGDVVPAASEIVRITTGRPGYIVGWVPERAATTVSVGRELTVRRPQIFGRGFTARIVDVSPEVEEVPIRARTSPGVPAWGRRIILEGKPEQPLVFGEALHVAL